MTNTNQRCTVKTLWLHTILKGAGISLLFAAVAACDGGGGGSGGESSGSSSSSSRSDGQGGSDSSSSDANADRNAPTATITFPPARSNTQGDRIVVRGTAVDPEGSEITVVRVNGVDATSSDDFANWHASVPLDWNHNTLTVETGDIALNTDRNAASVEIEREWELRRPGRIVMDRDNGRALMLDTGKNALVWVDMDSGARRVLSGPGIPDDQVSFLSPSGVELDKANNRALVIDSSLEALIAVNLDNGRRTVLSGDGKPDAVNLFDHPDDVVIDANRDRILVTDAQLDALMTVDPDTGARGILSDADTPGTNVDMPSPQDIELDPGRNRAIVRSGSHAYIEVDLDTGARQMFSDRDTPNGANAWSLARGLAVDAVRDRALVADNGVQMLKAVSLENGARTIVSPSGLYPDLDAPVDVVVDESTGRAYVTDVYISAVIAIDTDGGRSILSDNAVPDGRHPMYGPGAIVVDSANNRALVNDSNRLLAIDLDSGVRTVFSSNTKPDELNPFTGVANVIVDSENNRALVADSGADAILAVDLDTGGRTVLSDNDPPHDEHPFSSPRDMALDRANDRLLVWDRDLDVIIAVDPETGARTILSGNGQPDNDTPFDKVNDIAVDSERGRILVNDWGRAELLAVDPVTGQRTPWVSTESLSNLGRVNSVALDTANDRVLLVHSRNDKVFEVNLDTAEIGIASGPGIPNNDNMLNSPQTIALDKVRGRALVVDESRVSKTVMAIDLTDGQRVILSQVSD